MKKYGCDMSGKPMYRCTVNELRGIFDASVEVYDDIFDKTPTLVYNGMLVNSYAKPWYEREVFLIGHEVRISHDGRIGGIICLYLWPDYKKEEENDDEQL